MYALVELINSLLFNIRISFVKNKNVRKCIKDYTCFNFEHFLLYIRNIYYCKFVLTQKLCNYSNFLMELFYPLFMGLWAIIYIFILFQEYCILNIYIILIFKNKFLFNLIYIQTDNLVWRRK